MIDTEKKWFVYVIETDKKNLYTGITTDVEKRFQTHATGKGAKFFRTQAPKKIIFTEQFDSKGAALQKECAIKKLSPDHKRNLIRISKRKTKS